ncbi:MAG: ABC transporter permease [Pirellulaceae bacterium]
MKWWHCVADAIHGLWIRRGRALLNTVGVVVSCGLVLCTLAAATGIRNSIAEFIEGTAEAKRFRVVPDYDRAAAVPEQATQISAPMTDRRRERMSKLLENQWKRKNLVRPKYLSPEQLSSLRELDNVADVVPGYRLACTITLPEVPNPQVAPNEQDAIASTDDKIKTTEKLEPAGSQRTEYLTGESLLDQELNSRVIFGEYLRSSDPKGLLLHESLLFDLGFASDGDIDRILGEKVVLTLRRSNANSSQMAMTLSQLRESEQELLFKTVQDVLAGKPPTNLDPQLLKLAKRFTNDEPTTTKKVAPEKRDIQFTGFVQGIVRGRDEDDVQSFLSNYFGQGRILIHHTAVAEMAGQLKQDNTNRAFVYMDNVRDLDDLSEQAKALSVRPISAAGTIQRLYDAIDRSKYAALVVASIILLVAAVGISNTMIISVIERSEEIGIRKALGTTNQTITSLILLEGLFTGLFGAVLAAGCSQAVIYFGEHILKGYVEERLGFNLQGQVLRLETWMVATTIVVAALVATFAGIWPAIRASRLDPIRAMSRT